MDLQTLINNEKWLIDSKSIDGLRNSLLTANKKDFDFKALLEMSDKGGFYQSTIKGDVAILPIKGAMIKNHDIFARLFGMTSYDILNLELQALAENPDVKSIVLEMDTAGGVVSGVMDFIDTINTIKETKPIYAYISDKAFSAGYWIASQATKIMSSPTGAVGSIGAMVTFYKELDNADYKTVTYTSKNAPNKNADIESDVVAKETIELLNDIEQVFMEAVAKGRKTTTDDVKNNYGNGGIISAKNALKAGMIDSVGTMKDLLLQINKNNVILTNINEEVTMSKDEKAIDVSAIEASARAEAVKAERERVSAIMGLEQSKSNPSLVQEIVSMGLDVEQAKKLLSVSMPAVEAKTESSLHKLMANAENNPEIKAGSVILDTPKYEQEKSGLSGFSALLNNKDFLTKALGVK
jgi:ClpP class serine protease